MPLCMWGTSGDPARESTKELASRRMVRLTDRTSLEIGVSNIHVGLHCCRLDPVSATSLLYACPPFPGISAVSLTSSVLGCPSFQVYRFSSETKTFLRNCGDLLNMSSHSDTAIMRRLETLLEGRIDVASDVCLRASHNAGSWKAGGLSS